MKDYNQQFHTKSKKTPLILVATVVVLAVLLSTVFFGQTSEDNQGYRTICVVETSGKVSVVKDGIEYSAYPGMLLQEGHEIITSGGSYVRLVLDDDKYVKLEAGSKLTFETLGLIGSGKTRMNLQRGALTSELINPLGEDEEYLVNTPNAVLAVRGTFFRVDLSISEKGEVRADVMTYGGQVASQRVLPTGEIVEEEVLIDAGFKTAINMTQEDTHYLVEVDDGETIIVEPNVQTAPVLPTQPITTVDIPDDDLVDVYFAAENGHELFVTAEEVKADIEVREIKIEEKTSVYEKTEEVKTEQEAIKTKESGVSNTTSASVIANDSKPIVMAPVVKEESDSGKNNNTNTSINTSSTTNLVTDGDEHKHEKATKRTEPTCMQTGQETVYCRTCNKNLSVTELPATGHIEANGAAVDAHKKCSTCGTILSTNHSYASTTTAPTCTKIGSTTYTCSCGYSYIENIPALGHKEQVGGSKDAHKKCSVCGTITSSEHKVTNTGYVAPTCTKAGSESFTCECGYTYTNEIAALGHIEEYVGTSDVHTICGVCSNVLSTTHEITSEVEEEGNCNSPTVVRYSCECGYSYTSTTGYGDHDWSKWTEVSYPTCEESGENRRECNICYETETETIEATGHTSVNGGTENIHSICETCDEVLSIEHNMTNTAYVAPSCTEAGSDTYTCDCGYTYTNEVAALGHNFAEEFTIDVEATCTTDGSKSKHCSQCSEKSEVTVISAIGHSETFGGTEEQHTFCAVCMETLSNVHAYTNTETQAATCETDGVMTHACECGYEYTTVIDAFGHNYVEKEEVGDDGYTTTYEECENCGDIINETTVLALNTVNFPDENFRAFLDSAACNTDGEEGLTREEVSAITSLTLKGDGGDGQITTDGGIRDLTGIEYLTELTILDVSYNANLSTLDVSENTKLASLVASGSGITSIDTSGCSQLQTLVLDYCDGLSTLDISDNGALVELIISNTNLTTFNAGAAAYPVTLLDIRNSGITTIDMEKFYQVQILSVDANLTELDLNACQYLMDIRVAPGTALKELYVANTQNLNSLAFEGWNEITTIRIPQAFGVQTLELSDCPDLTFLDVSGTGLRDLDLSQNTALTSLIMNGSSLIYSLSLSDNEKLSTLEVTNCSLLQDLSIPGLPITSLDLTGCNMLKTLEAYDCTSLSQLDISDCTALTSLDISGTAITGFALSAQEGYLVVPDTDTPTLLSLSLNNTNIDYPNTQDEYIWWGALQNLNLGNAGVTQAHWATISPYVPDSVSTLNLTGSTIENIDLSGYTQLSILTLYDCTTLTTLDAVGCTALTNIVYDNCQNLTSVNISGCSSIRTISVNALPAIETFNASGCTSATSFNAYSGGATLKTLDISGCTNLGELTLNAATNLVSIDMSDSGVTQLYATNQQSLTSIDASNCTALTTLDVNKEAGWYSSLETLDLTGCTELRVLDLSYCQQLINPVDISACKKLTWLNVQESNMTSLDVTDCTALTDLIVTNATELTSINVTNCTSLTSLDTSTLTNLTTLIISGSGLEGVDLTKNTALTILTADGSALTTLDVTKCRNITDVNVANCASLQEFNAEDCSNLNQLNLSGCTTLNRVILTGCTSLTGFAQSAQENYIVVPNTASVTYLDLTQTSINYTNASADKYTWFGNLETLLISNAGITDAHWEKISTYLPETIKVLEIADSTITALDLSNYTELTGLRISRCSNLTSIDLSNNTELTNLECASSSLTNLDLSKNTKLTHLSMGGENLAFPDLSNNTAITALNVSINGLTTLDIEDLTDLSEFYIEKASLTKLDLTAYTSLEVFYAGDCAELETINLPSNGPFEYIGVYYCDKIETLDFSGFTVQHVEVGECNTLSELNLSNCSELVDLRAITCTALTELNLMNCTNLNNAKLAYSNSITTVDLTNTGSEVEEGAYQEGKYLVFEVYSGSTTETTLQEHAQWDDTKMSIALTY